ncbi:MAG: hypothetical protein R3F11_17505 [Verrucomicrobiales bacterium]
MKLQPLAVSMLLPPPSPMSRSTPPAFAAATQRVLHRRSSGSRGPRRRPSLDPGVCQRGDRRSQCPVLSKPASVTISARRFSDKPPANSPSRPMEPSPNTMRVPGVWAKFTTSSGAPNPAQISAASRGAVVMV